MTLAHFFIAASAYQISAGGLKGFKNLFNIFLEIALECNRDEWMLRVRRMGWCPCKQPGRPIARFHSNPSGKCLAARSALLHRLPIARAIGCALRLAAHPGKALVQLQKDIEQVLKTSAGPKPLFLSGSGQCSGESDHV